MSSILEELKQKFTSGNNVPVERATLTKQEYDRLIVYVEDLQAALCGAMSALDSCLSHAQYGD